MPSIRRRSSLRQAAAMGIAVSLAGCTSSGGLHVTTSATGLSRFKTVLVEVSSGVEGAKKEAIELEATVAMIAREKIPFQQVFTERNAPNATVDLRVEVKIVRLERVTAESRALNGLFAGRARVAADVVLVEPKGSVVGRFTAEGWSRRDEQSGTTEQAIKRASEQIV